MKAMKIILILTLWVFGMIVCGHILFPYGAIVAFIIGWFIGKGIVGVATNKM